MRFIKIAFLLCIAVSIISCSRSIKLSIKSYEATTQENEKLHFYIAHKPNAELSDKLLVMIQGSGRKPIKKRFGWGAEASLLGFDILYMEKYAYDDEEFFRETDCRERRIKDINFVINYVLNEIYNGKVKEMAIAASSESGAIAPEIALGFKNTKHLLIFGAGGLSQAEEFEILLEKQIANNETGLLQMDGIYSKEKLREKFEEIRNNPTTKKLWLGHTYKRWNSYLFYSPEEHISQLIIPTMFIIGEEDKSVPVKSVKYLITKLKGRDNFKFHIIPGVDHNFNDTEVNDKLPEIIKTIVIPWYKEK